MRILPALLSLIFLTACAGPRLATHGEGAPADAGRAAEALSRYNAGFGKVRAMGIARFEGEGEADYALRVERGEGARFDCFAGPALKPVLSAACSAEGKCEIYLPDENELYSDGTADFAAWFAAVLGGRVPVAGEVVSAWSLGGHTVVRFEGPSGWQTVLMDSDGLPLESLYGKKGGAPSLKIAYADFTGAGEAKYPRSLTVFGEKGEEKLLLEAKRVEEGPGKKPLSLAILVSEGTKRREGGPELMEKLGIFTGR